MSGKNNNLEYEAVEEETDDEEEDDEKGNGREVWVGGVALRLPVDQRGREGHRRSPREPQRPERSEAKTFLVRFDGSFTFGRVAAEGYYARRPDGRAESGGGGPSCGFPLSVTK